MYDKTASNPYRSLPTATKSKLNELLNIPRYSISNGGPGPTAMHNAHRQKNKDSGFALVKRTRSKSVRTITLKRYEDMIMK